MIDEFWYNNYRLTAIHDSLNNVNSFIMFNVWPSTVAWLILTLVAFLRASNSSIELCQCSIASDKC